MFYFHKHAKPINYICNTQWSPLGLEETKYLMVFCLVLVLVTSPPAGITSQFFATTERREFLELGEIINSALAVGRKLFKGM